MSNDPNEQQQSFPPASPYLPPTPVAYAPPPAMYSPGPAQAMETPVRVLGICFLIIAALGFLGALFIGSLMPMITSQMQAQNPAQPMLPAAFGVILGVIIAVIGGVLPLLTGIGLLRKASWGRILAIVNSILILISFPFGTILGGVTLYFMLRGGAKEGYEQLSRQSTGI